MIRRILVPLDGSNHAEAAMPLACTLANISHAEIALLHVVEYPYEVYSGAVYSNPNPLTDTRLDEKMWAKKEAIRGKVKDDTQAIITRGVLCQSLTN